MSEKTELQPNYGPDTGGGSGVDRASSSSPDWETMTPEQRYQAVVEETYPTTTDGLVSISGQLRKLQERKLAGVEEEVEPSLDAQIGIVGERRQAIFQAVIKEEFPETSAGLAAIDKEIEKLGEDLQAIEEERDIIRKAVQNDIETLQERRARIARMVRQPGARRGKFQEGEEGESKEAGSEAPTVREGVPTIEELEDTIGEDIPDPAMRKTVDGVLVRIKAGAATSRQVERTIKQVAESGLPEGMRVTILGTLAALQLQLKQEEREARAVAREREESYGRRRRTGPPRGGEEEMGGLTSKEAMWVQLRGDVLREENLDINRLPDFLVWFREMEFDMLKKRELDAVDLERYMTTSLGVYRIAAEQILEILPPSLSDPKGGGIAGLRDKLEAEMKFLSVTAIRKLQIVRTWGDLHEQVKQMASFAEGGSVLQLGAAQWERVNDFAPEVTRTRTGQARTVVVNDVRKTYERIDYKLDDVFLADRFKRAMAGYLLMKMIWQDEGGESRTRGAMGRRGKRFLQEELPAYGYTEPEIEFLKKGGTNIFWKHDNVPEAESRVIRAKIAIWAGGGDPNLLTSQEEATIARFDNLKKAPAGSLQPELLQAWEKGRLVEIGAYNLMFSGGVAQFLDSSGAGDMGLNLLLQTSRYMMGQARTGRRSASEKLIGAIDRLVPDFYELVKIGEQKGGGRSFQEWLLSKGVNYSAIPWLTSAHENPDRQYGSTLHFASIVFDYMREDDPKNHIDFGRLSEPAPGALTMKQTVINYPIIRQIQALWKACYLWSGIMQLKNSEHHIYRIKDHEAGQKIFPAFSGQGKPLSPTISVQYDKSFGLAKRVFREILVQHMSQHYPRSLFSQVTGISAFPEGTPMKRDDEAAAVVNLTTMLRRPNFNEEGEIVGFEEPVFTWGEVCQMINDAGGGDKAYFRRLLGSP